MNMQDHQQNRTEWLRSRTTTWVLLGFLAISAFFLITEHTAHLLGMLPFAIFLLCPLMMLFMHRGHGDHESNNQQGGHGDHTGNDQRRGHEEHPSQGERP